MQNRLLFHPRVTFTAMLFGLASFCTLVASIAGPLGKVPHGDAITTGAAIVGPVALWVATYGRSPAKSVDQGATPSP